MIGLTPLIDHDSVTLTPRIQCSGPPVVEAWTDKINVVALVATPSLTLVFLELALMKKKC